VVLLNPDKDFGADKKQPLPHPKLHIFIGEVQTTGFPDQSFDAVHCSETLEHIEERRELAISEIFRMLKPGGVFVGTIPIPGICHPKDEPDIYFLNPDSFKELVKDYCDTVSVEPTGSIFKTDNPVSWFFVCYKRKVV
jgi:SAM-dependent methyltransferase